MHVIASAYNNDHRYYYSKQRVGRMYCSLWTRPGYLVVDPYVSELLNYGENYAFRLSMPLRVDYYGFEIGIKAVKKISTTKKKRRPKRLGLLKKKAGGEKKVDASLRRCCTEQPGLTRE